MKTATIFLILTVIFLAGCSTDPVALDSASLIPSDRIYHPKYLESANSQADATVVFLRDSGFFGSGCSHDMYVNNIKVFAIRPGEQITLHLPASQYFFRLETGGGLCPNIAISQETMLESGAHQTYRILLPSAGGLSLTRVQ